MPHGGLRKYGGKAWTGAWDSVQHRFVFLYRGKTYRVARVICEAFNGPAPREGLDTVHIDEDSSNNQPSNLKWGTHKENMNCDKFRDYASRAMFLKLAQVKTKGVVPRRIPF